MFRRLCLVVLACWLYAARGLADEGMWLPQLLQQQHGQALVRMGLQIPLDELYHVSEGSLKDAVVLFGGGCTGEVISSSGLVLTNHHCGYGSIQSHSTVDHDYLTGGYWAMTPEEELPCPGLSVTFIVRIDDVTDSVLAALADTLTEAERTRRVDEAGKRLVARATDGTHYDAYVSSFYEGNKYFLFVTEKFTDIRLVGAPPSSIGNFGGDADNWMWPRHTGDFSMFRIYAGPDNKPADYAPANVPFTPRRHFTVSLNGVKEGDFTMVYGFPGRTMEYMTSDGVDLVRSVLDPARIAIRQERLRLIGEGMRLSDTVWLAYAPQQKRISNAYKKWQGEILGLNRMHTVDNKRAYEARYRRAVAAAGRPDLAGVVDELAEAYRAVEPYFVAYTYYKEAAAGIELLEFAGSFHDLLALPARGEADKEARDKALDAMRKAVPGFFKSFEPRIDKPVFASLLKMYADHAGNRYVPAVLTAERARYRGDYDAWADALYGRSLFAGEADLAAMLDHWSEKEKRKLLADPVYKLSAALAAVYNDSILPPLRARLAAMEPLNRKYMEGRLLLAGDSALYPDANSTLRLAYGRVAGYVPRDAVEYKYRTTLTGVMEKEDPSDGEFVVGDKLKALYQAKDYGRYGENGTMPVAFLATNHTTGGNSGSPVLNGKGELVGVNFDRVWEGTMSDYDFDPAHCRNIAVDIRYILFVVDKVAGCNRLIRELTLAP